MYYLHLIKQWFIQRFMCIHDWRKFEVGIEYKSVRECGKCNKFEVL